MSPLQWEIGVAATKAAASPIDLKDCSEAALNFFNEVRVPSSLVASASILDLFALSKVANDIHNRTNIEEIFIKGYHLFMLISFLLSINVIITSTIATLTIFHGNFDPIAETPYMLLEREFEYEFLSIRWSFLTSLMTFIVAVAHRIFIQFELFNRESIDVALAVTFFISSLVTHLLSYINSTLYSWNNLVDMSYHLMKLTIQRTVGRHDTLQLISVASSILACYFSIKAVLLPLKQPVKNEI